MNDFNSTDTYAPSKPELIAIGPHEILATWKSPSAPIGRINGYEVLVNGKVSVEEQRLSFHQSRGN